MRLINTANLQLEEFFDKAIPKYAILSHTWGQNEVVLADYEQRVHSKKIWRQGEDSAVAKIRTCCRLAAEEGHRYAWIDTCCIDKKSSAELSEAINSMYRWYKHAEMCYVYLSDVSKHSSWSTTADSMRQARWFTRGWTLQELLAPREIKFYDRDWKFLGGRWERDGVNNNCPMFSSPWSQSGRDQMFPTLISNITNIDPHIINVAGKQNRRSVAERMSWAAGRVTTRREDMAYCLLGLFDVNMPLLYGEGDKAFARLQAAIMEATDDHTLFAWNYGIEGTHVKEQMTGCLARTPLEHKNGYRLRCQFPLERHPTTSITLHYSLTNLGLHVTLRVIDIPYMQGTGVLAALACTDKRSRHRLSGCVLTIPLYQSHQNADLFHRSPRQTRPLLLEKDTFRESRPKTMYIETSGATAVHRHDGDDVFSCSVSGVDLQITERVPYFLISYVEATGNICFPTQSDTLYIDFGAWKPDSFKVGSTYTVGLKFDTQDVDIDGHGSFFVLVRYAKANEDLGFTISAYRLISGFGWPSLTSLMLEEERVDFYFQAPEEEVMLPDPIGSNTSQRLKCRRFDADVPATTGGEIFKFCLEAIPVDKPASSADYFRANRQT